MLKLSKISQINPNYAKLCKNELKCAKNSSNPTIGQTFRHLAWGRIGAINRRNVGGEDRPDLPAPSLGENLGD